LFTVLHIATLAFLVIYQKGSARVSISNIFFELYSVNDVYVFFRSPLHEILLGYIALVESMLQANRAGTFL